MRLFLRPENDSPWHALFRYEPSTGALVNRYDRAPRSRVGAEAGRVSNIGYIDVGVLGKKYSAHRIIWEMFRGEIPAGMEIDHVNGQRGDNRLSNLRLVTHSENMRNKCLYRGNTSGFRGASLHKQSGKYRARIGGPTGQKYLGTFPTAEEAHQAYLIAAQSLGYHENHGRSV